MAIRPTAIDEIVHDFEHAYQDAVHARVRITSAGLAYIALTIRHHLPTATKIAVQVDSMTLTAVHSPDEVLWKAGDGRDFDNVATIHVCPLLTDVLTFGRDEEALDDLGWDKADGNPGVYTATLPRHLFTVDCTTYGPYAADPVPDTWNAHDPIRVTRATAEQIAHDLNTHDAESGLTAAWDGLNLVFTWDRRYRDEPGSQTVTPEPDGRYRIGGLWPWMEWTRRADKA
ncbi:hypothetical protein [Streptomyces sp. NPDC006334]|uniref:hypothetical protein n=1 Tax=Streptomyces sp. NPDC006334 TaxID=3156754 RepID=UPI0033B70754